LQAVASATPEDTLVSRVFSGRAGRSLATDYVVRAAVSDNAPRPAPYPVQRGLTVAMRVAATIAGDVSRMRAWAGKSAGLTLGGVGPTDPAAPLGRRGSDSAILMSCGNDSRRLGFRPQKRSRPELRRLRVRRHSFRANVPGNSDHHGAKRRRCAPVLTAWLGRMRNPAERSE
jgi:hypothetical protein